MSDQQGSGTPAAGWYADPSGQAGVRWWDGAQWTSYTAPHPTGGAAAAAAPRRPLLPATTPVYNPFIWVIAFLPLVSVVSLFFYRPTMPVREFDASPTAPLTSIFTPGYFAVLAVSLVVWALTVVFALLDYRTLQRAGVVRPFHWAFGFLTVVYTIGRSVIVHQVARPRGLVPIWVTLGIYVLSFIVSIVWSVLLAADFMSQIGTLSGVGS
jgi:hypothetical protein